MPGVDPSAGSKDQGGFSSGTAKITKLMNANTAQQRQPLLIEYVWGTAAGRTARPGQAKFVVIWKHWSVDGFRRQLAELMILQAYHAMLNQQSTVQHHTAVDPACEHLHATRLLHRMPDWTC